MEPKKERRSHNITVPRFEGRHFLYMVLCLAGAAAALYFFWRDLNTTLDRFQEEPAGTVTRKQNIAQRRFADRTLWDRLRRQSPVYLGDYIRTAEHSGAVISLSGGELIELEDHTLIQIVPSVEGPTVELSEGALQVDTGDEGLTIRTAGASLRANAGSLLKTSTPDGIRLEAGLAAGSAVFTREGEIKTLLPGETISLSPAARRVAVLSPPPGAGFLNTSPQPLAVTFSWNPIGFDSDDSVRLEIAEDRAFTRILRRHESREKTLSLELENGQYYWRAYPAGQNSLEGGVSGRLSLVDAPPPELISPAPDEEFTFKTTRPGIRFLWTSRERAETYYIEISADPGMTKPLYQGRVQDSAGPLSSIVYSGFETGTWYWRVRAEYPRSYEGKVQPSITGSFHIRRAESLNAPAQRLPTQEASLYLEDKKERAYFSWNQEDDAVFYTFLLSRREDLGDPLIKQQAPDNYFVFDLKNGRLSPGQYYWGVYQTDSEGNNSTLPAARSVFIIAGPPPESPVVPLPAGETLQTALPSAEETQPESAPLVAAPRNPVPQRGAPKPEMPPLPAPANMRPAPGYALTEEIILRDRQITFSWNAVPGASAYVFLLYQTKNGGRREVMRRTQNETRFILEDLAVLDTGTFIWRVEPLSRLEGQKSEAGESVFTVSIVETQASQGQEAGIMFGTE